MKYVVGVDIGQSIDPTAIAVLEVESRREYIDRLELGADLLLPPVNWFRTGYTPSCLSAGTAREYLRDGQIPARLDVRYLERLPLRTSYPAVVEIVAGLMRREPLPGADLVVDSTGVGKPVVEVFRRGGLRPQAVTITGGDSESHVSGDDYRVSKLMLVSRLQALLHSGELKIAAELKEARALVNELQDFRTSFSESGVARFGAREGAHDDLVLAVAIAAWWATKQQPQVEFFSVSLWDPPTAHDF